MKLLELLPVAKNIIAAAEADGLTIGGPDGHSALDLIADNVDGISLDKIADVLELIDPNKYELSIARVRGEA